MNKTIEYVLAVAESGGITKAAKNLYITPSALSKYIIQKEQELGVKIFHREGNQFNLTYAGERYVELLKELREKSTKLDMEMSRLADMYAGRMRIGFQQSFSEAVTGKIVPTLRSSFPSVRMTLEEARYDGLLRMLRTNQIDVALVLIDEPNSDEFRCTSILKTPIVMVLSKDTDISQKAENREGFIYPWLSDDILREQMLVLDAGAASFHRYAGYLLEGLDLHEKSRVTIRSARTALQCVAEGFGMIVLPYFLIQQLHYEDRVSCFSFGGEETYAYFSVLSNPKSILSGEIENMENVVKSCFSV